MSRDGLPNMLAITAGNIMTHRQTAVAVRHEIERVVSPSGRGTGSISYRSRDGEPHEQAFNRQQMVDAARNEHVVNLDDLLFRRTGVAWLPSFGRDVARDAADVIAPEMGWDQKDIEVQLARFGATLETLRG
jgi:glycerol-3-phosphate dehydrogenase